MPMDLIDRQAAIEKLKREFNETDVPDRYPGVFDAIEEWLSECELPSAQPEIIRCKECVYADENYHCDYMTTWNDGDCFCCYGKRRTDGRFDKQTGGD